MYQIIYYGQILDGFLLKEVKQKLSQLFNTEYEQIEKLFTGQRIVIKDNLEHALALKYFDALQQQGAKCELKVKRNIEMSESLSQASELSQVGEDSKDSKEEVAESSHFRKEPETKEPEAQQQENAAHHLNVSAPIPSNPIQSNEHQLTEPQAESQVSSASISTQVSQEGVSTDESQVEPNPVVLDSVVDAATQENVDQWHKGIDAFETGSLANASVAAAGEKIVEFDVVPDFEVTIDHLTLAAVGEQIVEHECVEEIIINIDHISFVDNNKEK